jgi:hypothetical protein
MTISAHILGALHPSEPIYAVLDGARDRRIVPWIAGTRAPAWCLYRGELEDDLRHAAPHLLRLGRGHRFTEELFERGFGRAWGILFTSAAPPGELRRHLRKFLRVRTEDGRLLSFRYYDPRVLRAFLPTCTQDELSQLFGPITSLVAESAEEGQAHLYRLAASGLLTTSLSSPAP